jgi:glycosyltransferase involved in cell wall biosynthesis
MSRVVMLLSNPFRPDPRVLKEAESLAQAGHQVTVLCWDRANKYKPEERLGSGVQITRVQNVPSGYGIGLRQLVRLPRFWLAIIPFLRQLQPDIIHCHDFDTLPAGLWWGKTHRKPVIYDAHEYYADLCKPRLPGLFGNIIYTFIHIAEHIGSRLASAVVTVDETLGAIFRRYNPHIIIIGHYPSYRLATKSAPVFSRPNLVLLYIGRLSEDRGLLIYIDILRQLREIGIPARLHLAGVFTPAGEESKYKDHAFGLEDFISYYGWFSYERVPELLYDADLGLAILCPEPRYIAALPVKMFEYMAAGLPVLVSNFKPIADVINETGCGILVDPLADPKIAVNHIKNWWENPNLARKAGEKGRQVILTKYNWEILALELNKLYSGLINTG